MPKVSSRAKSRASKSTSTSDDLSRKSIGEFVKTPRPARKLSHATARSRIRASRTWPRRLLLHPMAVFGILITGVCLSGLTYKAVADSYTVSAVVPAPPLSQGAVITGPDDGVTVSSPAMSVSGSCPNESYVKLFRNSQFSGVAICKEGSFTISTSLLEGVNNLQAQDYTVTDAAGPVTNIVQVTYQRAAGSALPAAATPPPLLATDYHFNATTFGENFMWQLQFQDGQAPFHLQIEWGDGEHSMQTVQNSATFPITHHYDRPGYYAVDLQATDAVKRPIELQLVALVRRADAAPIRGAILPTGSDDSGSASRAHWLVYIWPTYLIIAAMVASFWLGERRELLLLTARAAARPKRPRVRHS